MRKGRAYGSHQITITKVFTLESAEENRGSSIGKITPFETRFLLVMSGQPGSVKKQSVRTLLQQALVLQMPTTYSPPPNIHSTYPTAYIIHHTAPQGEKP